MGSAGARVLITMFDLFYGFGLVAHVLRPNQIHILSIYMIIKCCNINALK